jgi:hypothetical protein
MAVSNAKITVEECHSIDILPWSRGRQMRAGSCYSGSWEWLRSRTGDVVSSIHYSIELLRKPQVRIHYKEPRSGELLACSVGLVSTVPTYGGLRWWFLCPAMVKGQACRPRVRKLYLAPGQHYFACRHCCELCYRSQSEDAWTRALSKAQAIRVRLGGSAAIHKPFPPKPKRMAWKTYRLLRARSNGFWLESLSAGLGRSAPALGDDTGFGDR